MIRIQSSINRNTFLPAIMAAVLFSVSGCVLPKSLSTSDSDPNSIVVLQLHIKGNKLWVVDFWKDFGYSSTRTQVGDLRIIVYSQSNKVLEDFMIPDPRKGIPYENFDQQVVDESFEDDIDFYVSFPAYGALGKVEVYDQNMELMVSINISEASFKTP